MQPHQQKFLEQRFGFRSYSVAEDAGEVSRATFLVEEHLGQAIKFEIGRVLVNKDLIYVPYGWIGCVGFLVHRRTERVILLGSVLVPHEWVWAFYRRFSLGETKFDRHDTLIIRAIHKPNETLHALRWLIEHEPKFKRLGRQLQNHPWIIGHLQNPPWIIRDVDLLFAVRDFMEAEEGGYFDFEINPTGPDIR